MCHKHQFNLRIAFHTVLIHYESQILVILYVTFITRSTCESINDAFQIFDFNTNWCNSGTIHGVFDVHDGVVYVDFYDALAFGAGAVEGEDFVLQAQQFTADSECAITAQALSRKSNSLNIYRSNIAQLQPQHLYTKFLISFQHTQSFSNSGCLLMYINTFLLLFTLLFNFFLLLWLLLIFLRHYEQLFFAFFLIFTLHLIRNLLEFSVILHVFT